MNWMPVPALGGVNLFDDPRAIRDDEVQLARNLVPVMSGILKKRGGLLRPSIEIGGGVPVAALMNPVPDGADVVVAVRDPSGGAGYLAGSRFGTVAPDVQLTLPFDHPRLFMLPWGGKVYALPGPYAAWAGPSQAPFYVLDATTTGSTPLSVVFQGTGNENVYPSVASPYKSRLVLANFGKGYENTIVFTDDFTADVVGDGVLSVAGRGISLKAAADGDEIVAMIEVMLTNVGSPAEAGLLILQRHGAPYLLTGDMDQHDGTGDVTLDIKRMSISTGCAGPYSVVRTPVGIVWAGSDDVWCFAAGVMPHRLGQKIQPAMRLTPPQLQYRWSAAYHDGFYRLAVWGAGQPMTATDAPGDQWWLDLREGLPQDWREARWWGPQQFLGGATVASPTPTPRTWAFVTETRMGKEDILYYVDRSVSSIGVAEVVVGEYGTDTRDLTAPTAAIADADYVDPEVTAELVTKEYALAPARDQLNDGLMAVFRPSTDATINVDFVLDDGDQVSTRTKYLTAPDQFRLDISSLDAERVTGKAIKTALYPQIRRAAQTHRFRIYDTAGWFIVAGYNDLFIYGVTGSNGTPNQHRITVPPGFYATLEDLHTAMASCVYADVNGNNGQRFDDDLGDNNVHWTQAGGLATVSDFPNPGFSNFIISQLNNTGTADGNATADDLRKCRRLSAMFGFGGANNPGWTGDFVGTLDTLLGQSFAKGISDWEIYGIAANMEVLPRTP